MRYAHCHLDRILNQYGVSRADFEEVAALYQSTSSRIINGYTRPTISSVLRILNALETLTGKKFDVREVWTLSDKQRFPKPENRGGYRYGQRRAA